jgi:hypothetical protein
VVAWNVQPGTSGHRSSLITDASCISAR